MAPLSSAQVERMTRLRFTFCTVEELGEGGAMEIWLSSTMVHEKGERECFYTPPMSLFKPCLHFKSI